MFHAGNKPCMHSKRAVVASGNRPRAGRAFRKRLTRPVFVFQPPEPVTAAPGADMAGNIQHHHSGRTGLAQGDTCNPGILFPDAIDNVPHLLPPAVAHLK